MAGSAASKTSRRKANAAEDPLYDRELDQYPPELRWREWMLRVEAVIFGSAEPVSRETLARVVGKDCSIDLLIDDLVEELRDRPYELVSVAGGWQHRTRPRFAETIRAFSAPTRGGAAALSEFEAMVLMAVGYFQPVTRAAFHGLAQSGRMTILLVEQRIQSSLDFAEEVIVLERGRIAWTGPPKRWPEDHATVERLLGVGGLR